MAPPKTKRSRRTIPISTDTAQALLRRRDQQQLERSHAGTDWIEHGLVFTAQGGNPLHPSTLTKAHDFIIAKAGVRRLTVHELRHSFTSLARAAGVDLKVISEILGHATVAFTADFYQHTYASLAIRAKMDSLLLADRLGHRDPAFTLRVYGHVFDQYRQSGAISMKDLLKLEEVKNPDADGIQGQSGDDEP